MNDREGAMYLVKGKPGKRVRKIWADMGYCGKQLRDFMKIMGKDLEIVHGPRKWIRLTQEQIDQGDIPVMPSFTVLPRRWVVKKTFVRTRTKQRMKKRLFDAYGNFLDGEINDIQMDQRLQSYLGILSHANQYDLSQAIKNAYWVRGK